MIVVVTSRHMDVTPALKAFAEQKVAKLTRYYDRIQEIEVVVDSGKAELDVEIIVTIEPKATFIAKQKDADAYAAIDLCIDKLERQLTEYKEKHRNHKHSTDGGAGRPVSNL